jgi:hypothetical protein
MTAENPKKLQTLCNYEPASIASRTAGTEQQKNLCHDSKHQHTPASPTALQQPEKCTITAADSLASSKSIRRTYTPASLNGSAPTSKLTP